MQLAPLTARLAPGDRLRGLLRVALAVAVECAFLAAGASLAQPLPNGGELQVNNYTTGHQRSPAVAAGAEGDFVVVWQSLGSTGGDTAYFSVQARLFGPEGAALGPEFQINSYATASQSLPAVGRDDAGNFIVAWQSQGSAGSDTNLTSIQAQRFDAGGGAQGGEFQVNSFTAENQDYPAIAADGAGGFVVVWQSAAAAGGDTSGFGIAAQRFAAGGAPIAGEFQVNTYTTGGQVRAAAAALPAGGFVVVWSSEGSAGSDSSGASIQARLYDGNGAPASGEFQVNDFTINTQQIPAVAADALGNFVIAWESDGSSGSDEDGYSIQARRYSAAGTALGGQFQVNSYTTSQQREPRLTVDRAGHFVVAWASFGSDGSDSSSFSVQAQSFDADGSPMGPQFQVNSYTSSSQFRPALASGHGHDFVVLWQSYGSSGTDTSAYSVQLQRYGCLFCDDLETGDSSRWSLTVP